MAEQHGADKRLQDLPPLFQESGLLEQFNLPPKLIRFLRRYQSAIWAVIAAAIVLALALAGYNAYTGHRRAKGAEALDTAMQAGENRRDLLAQVRDDYASTPSALWAEVALARMNEQENKADEAIQRYQAVRARLKPGSQLMPLVLGKLAALEEQKKNWEAALAYYQELGKIDSFAADAHLNMGRLYEAQAKKDEALAMYKKFLEFTAAGTEQSGPDPRRQMIQSHIELLQAN